MNTQRSPILRAAVSSAAEDQARLQSVAGRHVHVVYFDTVLAAADVLDDRAWDDLTARVGAARAPSRRARRAAPRARLPQLARSAPRTVRVGGLAPRGDRRCRDAHRFARAARLTGSRAGAARRVAGQRGGDADRCSAHDAGRPRARTRASASTTPTRRSPFSSSAPVATTPPCAPRDTCFDHDSVGLGTLALADLVESAARCGEIGCRRTAHWSVCRNEPPRRRHRGRRGLLARARALVANGDEADDLLPVGARRAVALHDRDRDGTNAAAVRRVVATGAASQGSARAAARGARVLRDHRRVRVRLACPRASSPRRASTCGAGRRL